MGAAGRGAWKPTEQQARWGAQCPTVSPTPGHGSRGLLACHTPGTLLLPHARCSRCMLRQYGRLGGAWRIPRPAAAPPQGPSHRTCGRLHSQLARPSRLGALARARLDHNHVSGGTLRPGPAAAGGPRRGGRAARGLAGRCSKSLARAGRPCRAPARRRGQAPGRAGRRGRALAGAARAPWPHWRPPARLNKLLLRLACPPRCCRSCAPAASCGLSRGRAGRRRRRAPAGAGPRAAIIIVVQPAEVSPLLHFLLAQELGVGSGLAGWGGGARCALGPALALACGDGGWVGGWLGD